MKKLLIILTSIIIVIGVVYWTGPSPFFEQIDPEINDIELSINELDSFLIEKESHFPNIKPFNESRIVWADTVRKTEYALVYLHGFSAGVMESNPVHIELAKKYGMNLYLARLDQHGLDDTESFLNLTPASYVNSAKEAIAIGQLLGDNVIVMSCSTGGTISIYLTAHNPEMVHAQILYSPNIEIHDPLAKLVNKPWGKQMLHQVYGDYREVNSAWYDTDIDTYWHIKYRIEGLITLQELLDQTMTKETFSKIESPYFAGYYFKNEEESDHVISTEAIKRFDKSTNTPDDQKMLLAFPNVGNHVIASDLRSKDLKSVIDETSRFMEDILHAFPAN